ncbi:MAG TPA: ankyrin repeat domain-containing protein [Mucilaginibacter sp.]|jgi:peptide-methionine (S)-S-oxide reductase
MNNSEITDPLFLETVEAIDSGDTEHLESLVTKHPRLIVDRLDHPVEGYFRNPYLLWFVADNPIRIDKLPPNITEITSFLITAVKRGAADSYQFQLDYTLGLVATGRIPQECGVQIEMMDLLINEGAKPGGGLGALAHGNIAAAEYLIERGGTLTLPVAVGLARMDDVKRLVVTAKPEELLIALTAAAFYGKPDMITYLLSAGVNPNGYPKNNSGFHSHATPLHQAVYSGSLDAVKLLVEAGADIDARDLVYDGTTIGWAQYMQTEESTDETQKKSFALIADYLLERKQTS